MANEKKSAGHAETLFQKATTAQPVEKGTSNYRDLLAQRDALEAQIREVRAAEVETILAQIRQLVDDYDLHDQVQFSGTAAKRNSHAPRGPAAVKYRDPISGATWTGRGKAPGWIAGKDREQFLVG